MEKIAASLMIRSNLVSFLVLGILEAAWAPMVPFIKNRFALNEAELGWLLLCTGFGAVSSLPCAGFFTSHFGAKTTAKLSAIIMATALLMISFAPYLALCAVCLFIFGAMTITLDVSSNVNAVIVERENARPLMSGFHGGYSLGALFGAFFASLLLTIGLSLPLTAIAVFLLCVLLTLGGCKYLIKDIKAYENHEHELETTNKKQKTKRFYVPPLIILIGTLCLVMYGAEGSVMSWSAVFVHQERGFSLEYAGFVYTAFAVTMTGTRFAGNYVVSKIGRRRTVVIGGLLVATGFLITTIPSGFAAVAGFALVGFGTGNIVPQMVSFAGSLKGFPVHKTIAIINALGYTGILIGPVGIGFVADHLSIAAAFALIALLTFIVATVNFVIMRPKLQKSK